MGRLKKATPAHTNIKIRKHSRDIVNSWKNHLHLDSQSDAIDEVHRRLFKTTVPLAARERS